MPTTRRKPTSKPSRSLPSQTPLLLGLLVALAVGFLLGMLFTKVQYLEKNGVVQTAPLAAQAPNRLTATPAPGQKVNVDVGHLPIKGDPKAKVTVIEFADFQCPFCQRFFTDTEPNLLKDYVATGKVKFAFRHYAFLGQESTWAAEASECANEQGKFWEYHDFLYSHQGAENSGAFAKDKLEGFAQSLGLNTDQFNSCLNSNKYQKQVTDDFAAGQKAGVSGTPSTFIDGIISVGAQPYASFKTVIEAELAK